MSRQKISILIVSIIGLASSFLPWVKGFLIGTVIGISGPSVNKDFIWLIMGLFLLPILIIVVNKSIFLTKWTLFWTITPLTIAMLVSAGLFTIDFNSPSERLNVLIGVEDASELQLTLGPAPYIVFIAGLLAVIFGIVLKPRIHKRAPI